MEGQPGDGDVGFADVVVAQLLPAVPIALGIGPGGRVWSATMLELELELVTYCAVIK